MGPRVCVCAYVRVWWVNESVWWLFLGSRVTAVVVPRKQQQPMHMLRLGAATCNNLRNYLLNSYLGDWGGKLLMSHPPSQPLAWVRAYVLNVQQKKGRLAPGHTVQIHSQLLGAALWIVCECGRKLSLAQIMHFNSWEKRKREWERESGERERHVCMCKYVRGLLKVLAKL